MCPPEGNQNLVNTSVSIEVLVKTCQRKVYMLNLNIIRGNRSEKEDQRINEKVRRDTCG